MKRQSLSEFGSGNSQVNCSYEKAYGLYNDLIDKRKAYEFIDYIGESNINIMFTEKKTKKYIASAQPLNRSIVFYNHIRVNSRNAWVFLHELSHVIASYDSKNKFRFVRPHGKRFARSFELLIELYNDFIYERI